MKWVLGVALLAFCLGAVVYAFLDQYNWGRVLISIFFTMLFFEASATSMVANHKPLLEILIFLAVADVGNVLVDLYAINRLLSWRLTRQWIDGLNRLLKKLRGIVSRRRPGRNSNGLMDHINAWQSHVQDIKKNPSKAGLITVLILAAMPRIPFMILGGVSLAILVLRFNRFGWRGWAALVVGIAIRTAYWLVLSYGLISI